MGLDEETGEDTLKVVISPMKVKECVCSDGKTLEKDVSVQAVSKRVKV